MSEEIRFSVDEEVFTSYCIEVGASGGTIQDLYDKMLKDGIEVSDGTFTTDIPIKKVESRLSRLKAETKAYVKAGVLTKSPPWPTSGKKRGRSSDHSGMLALLKAAMADSAEVADEVST